MWLLVQIGDRASTWHCSHCFKLFHLGCIQRWARGSLRPTLLLSDVLDLDKIW